MVKQEIKKSGNQGIRELGYQELKKSLSPIGAKNQVSGFPSPDLTTWFYPQTIF